MDAGHLELRHLRYFVAVAEELHFGRAAARLNMAQPPLSQQIRQLEVRLGAQLFVRTSRRVELTTAGQVFLDHARRALAEVSSAADAGTRAGRGEFDTLRVGFINSSALNVLPGAIAHFHRAHPTVHLDLVEGSTASLLTAVERNLVDVAVLRGPALSSTLQIKTVMRERYVVALPRTDALAARQSIALSTLAGAPMILFPSHRAPAFHHQIVRMCLEAGFTPNIVHNAAEYQTILSLVAAGLGISIVPSSTQNLQRTGVVFRPLHGTKARAEIVSVCRAGQSSRPLSNFLESLARSGSGFNRSHLPSRAAAAR